MPLPGPLHIPPIGEQTDPDKVRVAAVIGGQLASAPARGFGLTSQEFGNLQAITAGYSTTAQTRSRIVNGAMQISQELGFDTNAATTGSYGADQWYYSFATSGVPRLSTVSTDPEGKYLRLNSFSTIDTSVDAADLVNVTQRIEGIRVADFLWGTASAKPAVLRFTGRSNVAGGLVISASLRVIGGKSFIKNVTLTSAWQDFTIPIPANTATPFPIDTSSSIWVTFTGMCGANNLGTAENTWVASGIAVAGIGNIMAVTSSTMDIKNVGLYLDPQATGVAPPWQMPDEAEELRACMRYYYKLGSINYYMFPDVPIASTLRRLTMFLWPVPFRVNPTVTGTLSGVTSANFGFTAVTTHAYGALTDANSATGTAILTNIVATARM